MSIPRVYWPTYEPGNLPLGRAEITGDQAHHIRHVLRLQPGTTVGLFDGRGREWVGVIGDVAKHQVTVADVTPTEPVAEPAMAITLAIGILKGDQMDAVVRDATMLGVSAIVPLHTAHVAVPAKAWKTRAGKTRAGTIKDGKTDAARERWQRVAVASAGQCRRAVVPEIHPVATLADVLAVQVDCRLVCVEPARASGAGPDWRTAAPPASLQLLVGPEGGWTEDELLQAFGAGARPMSLGPRTLRAETTPMVAMSVVAATWGW